MIVPPALIRSAQRLSRRLERRRLTHVNLIPREAQAIDRRQCDFLQRSVRQLMRHGAWEQAWALLELSTEAHRYNPAFHRASEKLRKQLSQRLHAGPDRAHALAHPALRASLDEPFCQLCNCPESALIAVDPQAINHWGCVLFPSIIRGRFRGARWRRFCNAVVDERYLFRGLALADDPQVQILRRRYEQNLSWEESGGFALFAERRRRRRDKRTTWDAFLGRQLRHWDELFRRIQVQGYRSQAELQSMGCEVGRYGLFNEVEVCVNGKGKVFFLEGKHRLVMAQILGLPSIPVIVNVWSNTFLEHLPGPFSPQLAQEHLTARPRDQS